MPLTRNMTVEEDVVLSMTTVITGLMAKYNYNGTVNANAMFQSILGNTALHINQMIEEANMTIVEKGVMRGDLKSLANKAFRAKMTIVNANDQPDEDEAPHEHIPADAPPVVVPAPAPVSEAQPEVPATEA